MEKTWNKFLLANEFTCIRLAGKSELLIRYCKFPCAAGDTSSVRLDVDALFNKMSLHTGSRCEGTISADNYSLFQKFCQSGLCRKLGLKPLDDINFCVIWKEVEPYVVRLSNYFFTAALRICLNFNLSPQKWCNFLVDSLLI